MRPAVGLLLFYKEKSEENENMKNYKIAVAGTGYVGLSLSVLLAQHNQVMAVDIVQAKVDMINNHKSPIQDDYIEKYLAEKELNLTATLDAKAAYSAVLSFENRKQMYIPRGFAHGCLTLEDDTLMQWCVDNDFCGEAAKAVRYDSDFVWQGESWPEGAYIISEKDRNAVRLENFCGR